MRIIDFLFHKLKYFEINIPYIYGGRNRLHIGKNVYLANVIINTASADVYIGDNTFFGYNVMILTGKHDINLKEKERKDTILQTGKDIHIGKGVWICSGAIILSGVTIGDNSVIGAGSIVTHDVTANSILYGNKVK